MAGSGGSVYQDVWRRRHGASRLPANRSANLNASLNISRDYSADAAGTDRHFCYSNGSDTVQTGYKATTAFDGTLPTTYQASAVQRDGINDQQVQGCQYSRQMSHWILQLCTCAVR
ncbi:hypothetical protein ABBQ38_001381 [Trebouxia sp. C0009 RCD-2024]